MGKEGEERKRESFLRCLFVGGERWREDELRKLKIASTHFRHCTSNCTRLFWFVPFFTTSLSLSLSLSISLSISVSLPELVQLFFKRTRSTQ